MMKWELLLKAVEVELKGGILNKRASPLCFDKELKTIKVLPNIVNLKL